MAKIKYQIRSKVKGKLVPIYLYYQDSNNHFRIKTEFKVKQEYWNATKQIIKPIYFDENNFSIEERNSVEQSLNDLKRKVEREITLQSAKGLTVTREYVSKIIDRFFNKIPEEERESLNQFIDRFVKEIKSGERLHDKHGANEPVHYGLGTIKNYEGFKNIWDEFQGNKKLDFEDIDKSVYDSFIHYCIQKPNKTKPDEPGLSTNTIGRHVKQLRRILEIARLEKLHNNTEYKNFKEPKAKVHSIYLNEDELKKLYDMKLSGMDEKIRDVFLIGCFTLQRFSDYSRISPSMIQSKSNNGKIIELIQTKTNQRVVIPIRPTLDTLLMKYDYKVPKVFPQKLNDRIKELARDVGITDPIQIEKYKGGKRINETVPKCDLIMSHTARRSGCTNMFKDGFQPLTIMKISGHKTEREFLKYILITREETADGLLNNPNFNKPSW
jgi:integrase